MQQKKTDEITKKGTEINDKKCGKKTTRRRGKPTRKR